MIDLYGNCTSIEFQDLRTNMNNFHNLPPEDDSGHHNQQQQQPVEVGIDPALPSQYHQMPPPMPVQPAGPAAAHPPPPQPVTGVNLQPTVSQLSQLTVQLPPQQVCSLTQLYYVGFLQAMISVKNCAFY